LPVSDDERVISLGCRPETGLYGVFPLVLDPFGAERAEGGGVGAALGREVAAEAEHVRPGSQAQAAEFGEPAKAEAFGDEAAGVLGSTADMRLSLRTLFVRSTLIGRGCLRHTKGPGGV
jgi:hypothetical protein